MIKFPKTVQKDLSKYYNDTAPISQSVRSALNKIYDEQPRYNALSNWLFNERGFKMNQVKFANYIGGGDYEFIDPEYTYQTKDGRFIGYNESTKVFTLGIKGNALGNIIRNNLTRDDILDSPFDINKLIEVPYNGEEKENDN